MSSQAAAKEHVKSLYDAYANDIYRYARMTLGHSEDAHDVVQEVFLRALRSWDGFRAESNAKTWLMTIARNYIYDLFRKKRTERKYVAASQPPDLIDSAPTPELLVEVDDALRQLKHDYRHVIVLRHMDNLSVEQTASVLGWSERKVRNTTHRALTKLRECLDPPEEVSMDDAFRTRNP